MSVKKTAFFLAIAFLLVSCGRHEWAETRVTNNSLVDVTFRFGHTGELTLSPGAYTHFETRAHQLLEWYRPYNRVWFDYQATNHGATGVFYMRPFMDIVVTNMTEEKATLSERGGWMDDMEGIPPGESAEWRIFSEKPGSFFLEPDFTATAGGIPANVRWILVETETEDTGEFGKTEESEITGEPEAGKPDEIMKVFVYFPW